MERTRRIDSVERTRDGLIPWNGRSGPASAGMDYCLTPGTAPPCSGPTDAVDIDGDGLLDDLFADDDGDGLADHATLDLDDDGTPEAGYADDGTGTWMVSGEPEAAALVRPRRRRAQRTRRRRRRRPTRPVPGTSTATAWLTGRSPRTEPRDTSTPTLTAGGISRSSTPTGMGRRTERGGDVVAAIPTPRLTSGRRHAARCLRGCNLGEGRGALSALDPG